MSAITITQPHSRDLRLVFFPNGAISITKIGNDLGIEIDPETRSHIAALIKEGPAAFRITGNNNSDQPRQNLKRPPTEPYGYPLLKNQTQDINPPPFLREGPGEGPREILNRNAKHLGFGFSGGGELCLAVLKSMDEYAAPLLLEIQTLKARDLAQLEVINELQQELQTLKSQK